MKNNPFLSESYTSIWLKHFNQGGSQFSFAAFPDLNFVRHSLFPIYVNIGKTHTKGIQYGFRPNEIKGCKNKVFIIYDVPTYFEPCGSPNDHLKLIKLKQYPGFSITLDKYKDLNDYLLSTFSKNSRTKLNRYKKRLELCFEIEYRMFYGHISKNEFDNVFRQFKSLLEKRFLDKQITNNNLDPKEWNFYQEVAYPMILEKKASLFVIYAKGRPIGVTLNYLSDSTLIDAITVFDIDYSKFHVGSVTILKLIEWCQENHIGVLDFSKGEFDYKKRWANLEYDFEYHLYYDNSSILSTWTAMAIKMFYDLKQALRKQKINEKFHRITFWLRNISHKKEPGLEYEFSGIDQDYKMDELVEMAFDSTENQFLKHVAFDFLYINNEAYKDLRIYKITPDSNKFLLRGKTISTKVTLTKPPI